MKGLSRFYIWFPMELKIKEGSTSFKYQNINYLISVTPSEDAILSIHLNNSLVAKEHKNENGYVCGFKEDFETTGTYQVANFKGAHGNKENLESLIDFTDTSGRFCKNSKYTKIKVLVESPVNDEFLKSISGLAVNGLDHFLRIYRYVTSDTLVKESRLLSPFKPFMLGDYINYSVEDNDLSIEERFHKYCNLNFQNARSFQLEDDNYECAVDKTKVSGEIAYYLSEGELDQYKIMLTRSLELGLNLKLYNAAALEAFMAFEVEIIKFAKKLRKHNLWKKKVSEKISVVIKDILPLVVTDTTLIGELRKITKVRNDIVHNGYSSNESEFKHTHEIILKTFNIISKYEFPDST